MGNATQTHDSNVATRAQSKFWATSHRLIKFHTAFIWILVAIVAIIGAYATYFYGIGVLSQSVGTGLIVTFFFLLFLITTNVLADAGFKRRKNTGKSNWPLVTYVVLQSIFFTIGITITVLANYIAGIIRSTYGPSQPIGGAIFGTVIALAVLLATSFPLCLIVGRGAWVLFTGSKPDVDAAGKYVNCVNCGYDQRGTQADTCPECGESTVAVKTTTPTAAD